MDPLPLNSHQGENDADLPSYTPSRWTAAPSQSGNIRQSTEHVFRLTGGFNNKTWATLKLMSSASSPDDFPVLYEGSFLTGTFELDVKKESIVEVSLQMTGHMMYSLMDDFLDHSHVIWSQARGDPKTPTESSNIEMHADKLHGKYSWPFKVPIPRQATVKGSTSAAAQTICLPATFSEKGSRVSIYYEMHLDIRRGKFAATVSKLGTIILYIPWIKPEPPSPMRQLAYREETPIPGPDADPDGWKVLQPCTMRGSILNDRQVEVTFTLSLAKPLCYTRGTTIPFSVSLQGSNEQALDLLSSHKAIIVRLQHCMAYNPTSDSSKDQKPQRDVAATSYLGTAVWWPAPASGQANNVRTLGGEIQLSKLLKPSTEVPGVSLKYSVAVFPSQAISFHPVKNGSGTPLLTEGVEIGTIVASGPRARAYAPPGYNSPEAEITTLIGAGYAAAGGPMVM